MARLPLESRGVASIKPGGRLDQHPLSARHDFETELDGLVLLDIDDRGATRGSASRKSSNKKSSNNVIRLLTAADIPQALELSSIAGWNQTAEDWLMLINLAPESCFALECDGEIAATATLICYERRLAWIGMVLTFPAYRRRGFARTLVKYALETADRDGIETVKLDATDQGQPLYESLGFIVEQEIERWSGNGDRPSPACTEPARFPESFAALDLSAFAVNRSPLLSALASRARTIADLDGFLLRRTGRTAAYIGPCIARTPEIAKRMLDRCLNENEGPWLWDLLPANTSARDLALESGFHLQRKLVRMYRGTKFRGEEKMLFAIAGLELG